MPRSFNKSNPSEIEEMREMYRRGYSFPEIARFFNVHHTVVMYWCGHIGCRKPKDLGGRRIEVDLLARKDTRDRREKAVQKLWGAVGGKEGWEDTAKPQEEAEKKNENILERRERERQENNRRYKERLHHPEKFMV